MKGACCSPLSLPRMPHAITTACSSQHSPDDEKGKAAAAMTKFQPTRPTVFCGHTGEKRTAAETNWPACGKEGMAAVMARGKTLLSVGTRNNLPRRVAHVDLLLTSAFFLRVRACRVSREWQGASDAATRAAFIEQTAARLAEDQPGTSLETYLQSKAADFKAVCAALPVRCLRQHSNNWDG